MVRRSEVIDVMEQLEALGATRDSGNADQQLPAVGTVLQCGQLAPRVVESAWQLVDGGDCLLS